MKKTLSTFCSWTLAAIRCSWDVGFCLCAFCLAALPLLRGIPALSCDSCPLPAAASALTLGAAAPLLA